MAETGGTLSDNAPTRDWRHAPRGTRRSHDALPPIQPGRVFDGTFCLTPPRGIGGTRSDARAKAPLLRSRGCLQFNRPTRPTALSVCPPRGIGGTRSKARVKATLSNARVKTTLLSSRGCLHFNRPAALPTAPFVCFPHAGLSAHALRLTRRSCLRLGWAHISHGSFLSTISAYLPPRHSELYLHISLTRRRCIVVPLALSRGVQSTSRLTRALLGCCTAFDASHPDATP